ncbi:polymorphic toxin-type HINT domain-containing protein [Streptomyces sp. NBC_00989]|uniref:polymorphic toxin-type HINT domain-containing protein n=1 Tax=Streptomyces sp. NBC_00989 TaxID=2903705 RepID=UPI0038636FB8|nr:polymorphic toxin-type HINT domain-containing protein [Streptomyces sp. NBC_00989]
MSAASGARRRRHRVLTVGVTLALAVAGLTPVAAQAATSTKQLVPAVPEQRSDTVKTVDGLGAKKARARVAAAKAANKKQAQDALAEQKATWPKASSTSAPLAASGVTRLRAGGLPVSLSRTAGAKSASGTAGVQVLSRKTAAAAGIKGVLLTASASGDGNAKISVDYSAFASAYGGDWAGRLHLVQLPACALTTPDKAACRVQTPLDSHNNIRGQSVSATVPLGQTPVQQSDTRASRSSARTAELSQGTAASATVLALTATSGESASGSGNYSASPLSSSSSWQAGGSSGAFTWSYPLSTPPAAAGPAPSLSLGYDSGSTDGKTASTNNQSTQVGEGFDLSESSYIERSYASCDDDGQTDKHDECWKYDNASLVLNGKSTELVKNDADGAWHLKDDDASTVTHSTGADNDDDGVTGNDGKGEYWTVTTGDGTQYVFGLNKLPGADAQRTNSVWTAPVFGDDSGEPGYDQGSSFADRSLTQAWRWNLDYVVDLHGNAMSYWYTAETNYYPKNGASTANTKYTRGGHLDKILYGQRASTLFTGTASDEVTFSYDERCTASDCSSLTDSTSDNWPDVPFDAICASGADDCNSDSPSFFSRKRLTGIDTLAYSAATSAYTAVDSWALTQKFLDGQDIGDTSDETLVLSSIQHTGQNGTDITLDPVTFTYQLRPNRVDSTSDDILKLSMPRIATVTSETGAITTVTLSDPECVRGSNMPSSEDNDTLSCYPQYWHINGATESLLDWFHKYRVTAVLSTDPTGLGEGVENSYSYADPAWHYNFDPLVPADERTWSQWRGYGKVTTTTGAAGSTQSKTVSLYMQGMDGDKQSDGTTASATRTGLDVSGLDVSDLTDSDQYAGSLREQVTYNGAIPVTVTVNSPWSKQTASQQKSYASIKAYYVRTGQSSTSTYLTASATWRTRTTSTTYDDYGMPTQVNDTGQTGVSGDNTCTRTWYARNTGIGLTSLVSRTRVVGQDCSVTEAGLNLPTASTSRGDVLSDSATSYDNASATAWSATQTPTLGEATWTGRAVAYPAAVTNGERFPGTWQTVAKTTYDDSGGTAGLGRRLTVTDTAGNTTATAYTPTDSGPLTKTKVTNAKAQATYTYTDYASGLPTKVYDVNNKITETSYDALGRETATWLTNRSHSANQTPNYTYAYSVTNDAPSWTSTSTLKADGTTYNTAYTIYDSLLRPLQTQSPTPDGGRLLTDTRYDSRGLAYETYADVFDSANLPSGTYARAEYGGAPKQTETVFDGVGRATSSSLYAYGVKKWTTSTSYTGDSTATTALNGGSATRTITDIFGNTVEKRAYAGTDPADAAYGAGAGAAYTSTKYTYTLDNKPLTVTGPDNAQWSYVYDLFGRQTSASDPDLGTTSTSYTALDQTDTTTDNRGTQLLYGYDVLGRKTDQWQTAKTDANKLAHWDYDTLAKGQLDDAISYVGGTTGNAYTRKVTAYDSLYHATGSQLTLPSSDPLVADGAVASATLATTSYYNIDGTQQYYSEPAAGGLSSETVDYEYNGLGMVTDVGGATGYLLAADYNALGQVNQYTLGTSEALTAKKAYITNTYEEGTDRLTRSLTTDATRSVQDLNFTHDDAGNVTSTFDTANLSGTGATDYQCFTYDGYQRLTDAWTPSTASCATSGRTTTNLGGASPYWTSYGYTSSGLRTTETAHTGTGDSSRTYCYSTTTPHQLTATTTATSCTGVSATYGYDKSGDTTTRPNGTDTQTLTWNATGGLDTVTEKSSTGTTKSTTSHVYDADGNLLIRRNTSGETVLYLGATEVHLDTSTSTAKYWAQRYYGTGSATIALRTNKSGTQTLSYLSGDPHGTSTVSLDATTQAVTKRYLTPFGAARTGGTGVWADDKTFLGKTTDPTTSLTYVGAREYDSAIGRFLSVDPVLDTGDAQSLNGYTYADNSPVTGSDPSGLMNVPDPGGSGGSSDGGNKQCPPFCSADGQPHGPSTSTGGSNRNSDGSPGGGTVSSNSQGNVNGGGGGVSGWVSDVGKTIVGQAKSTVVTIFQAPVQQFLADKNCLLDGDGCTDLLTQLLMGSNPALAGAAAMTSRGEEIYGDYANGKSAEGTGKLLFDIALLLGTRGAGAEAEGEVGVSKVIECSFTPSTPVLMADGKTKPIGDIKTGDKVEAANLTNGKHQGLRTVTATHVNDDYDLVDLKIQLADGKTETLHTTSKHPFWDDTLHTWVPAGQLLAGHALNTADDRHVHVTAVTPRPGDRDMYNLTVEELHTYYVLAGQTPILVHNCKTGGLSLSGARHVSGRFPRTANPGETLYRQKEDGTVTAYARYDEEGEISQRADLDPDSAPHAGIPAPHILDMARHVNPKTGQVFRNWEKMPRPLRPEEELCGCR